MASTKRSIDRSVSQLLAEKPQRFEFFQAVRHLERLLAERAPVGSTGDPRHEVVRFRSHVGLAFPIGDLRSLRLPEPAGSDGAPISNNGQDAAPRERSARGGPAVMEVEFMGLATPQGFGALPMPYVELILDEVRERRTALRDFLDLFNHRFVSLFYRSWLRARLPIAAESGYESFFERSLFALMGLGTPALRERLALPDSSLLSRAGLLLRRPASAAAIEALLTSYFGVPARIEPFVRTSAKLESEDLTRIGRANSTLGQDIVLGSRVSLRESRFRAHLGPLTREQFESFQAHGSAYLPLCQLVRLAISANLDFDVELELIASEVPRLQLARGHTNSAPPPPRLGRSTWLLRGSSSRNRSDARISPPENLIPSRGEPEHRLSYLN